MYEIENNIPLASVPTAKQKLVMAARELHNKGDITKTEAAKLAIKQDNSNAFKYTDYPNAIQYIIRLI